MASITNPVSSSSSFSSSTSPSQFSLIAPSPHRGALPPSSKAALMSLSPPQHRHLRKLSQVTARDDGVKPKELQATLRRKSTDPDSRVNVENGSSSSAAICHTHTATETVQHDQDGDAIMEESDNCPIKVSEVTRSEYGEVVDPIDLNHNQLIITFMFLFLWCVCCRP